MQNLKRILVVFEPKKDTQVALKRAMELAKYIKDAQITVLRLVHDYAFDMIVLNRKKLDTTEEEVIKAHQDDLDKTIALYNKDNYNIQGKVVFTKDIATGIIKELNTNKYDLIIKGSNQHGILDSIIFTPIDWFILRKSPIPVIIAKDHEWNASAPIVVAVDFSDDRNKKLSVILLRQAQLLSTITKAKIHVVNAVPIILPSVIIEIPNYSPEVYSNSILEEHRQRLHKFAKDHNIGSEYCHISEGMPDDIIPQLCQKLNPQAVFIGSLGREGIQAALVGNTCEEIADYTDADLFVYNIKISKE